MMWLERFADVDIADMDIADIFADVDWYILLTWTLLCVDLCVLCLVECDIHWDMDMSCMTS